ncbi:MAG: protein kinase [Chloroflexi bacterium]|nr:protein kinase [Chloroflexota bacterium]
MTEQGLALIGQRYQLLNKLGEGGMGAVYRAFDRLHQTVVALKRVDIREGQASSGSDSLAVDTRVALAHEFQTLASLHHPHVINVLDYGFDAQRHPYFTMTFLENPRTVTEAAKDLPIGGKVRLLVQMLQALAYLHRRGLIHRDLKPDNALVDKNGDVQVLDFGLALLREQLGGEEEIVGTIAYMAPEVLQGQAPTNAADFYAVGVMAYEMFGNAHPFAAGANMIVDILYNLPDVAALDVEESLALIIARLLAKSPDARYDDAHELIEALCAATNQPIPQETIAIRDSFLQAAQFVGREKELKVLKDALDAAIGGQGAVWLVGGESGVGKSRLLSELRTRALVTGALVLHGQGVAEGGLAYQFWREPLRLLALYSALHDSDAGVLKQIVPDIELLLTRPIADAPELEGRAGQQRLLNTLASVFRQQQMPLLLVLEDLQWATESLDVLRHLLPVVSELPLMIIGSYRDDERPNLPSELPGAQVLHLERLQDEGIAKLSVSMLGAVGQQPEVLELLKRETEGNVYFLVEVVRVLAEEAGRLSDIGKVTLPRKVFAGGVQTVVLRRLQRVPEQARALLKVAAVRGRELDLDILRAVAPQTDFDQWLLLASEAAVLEVQSERWAFAHDKLRQGLLASLEPEESQRLNLLVAAALQQVYAQAADEYAGTIADHLEQGGDLAQAAVWYVRAGQRAQDSYAPSSAIRYYRKALELAPGADDGATERLQLYDGLGKMLNWQGQYEEAAEVFQKMRAAAQKADQARPLANAWLGLATAQIYQGEVRAALESTTRAEEVARAANERFELATALYMKGWNLVRLGQLEETLALAEQVLALCEELGQQSQKAQSLNLLGAVHYMLGHYQESARQFEQALAVFQEVGDRGPALAVTNNIGQIAEARGDYQASYERYQDALKTAREIGFRDAEMLYLSNLGGVRVKRREFAEAEMDLRQVIALAETIRFGQIGETYRFLAEACLGQDNRAEALEAAKQALAIGRQMEAQEYIAAAWRVLGQIAAAEAITLDENGEDKRYDARACFGESQRICSETGMEGELAQTLRAWARYEIVYGDETRGLELWQAARAVFEKLGADLEAERMATLTL